MAAACSWRVTVELAVSMRTAMTLPASSGDRKWPGVDAVTLGVLVLVAEEEGVPVVEVELEGVPVCVVEGEGVPEAVVEDEEPGVVDVVGVAVCEEEGVAVEEAEAVAEEEAVSDAVTEAVEVSEEEAVAVGDDVTVALEEGTMGAGKTLRKPVNSGALASCAQVSAPVL